MSAVVKESFFLIAFWNHAKKRIFSAWPQVAKPLMPSVMDLSSGSRLMHQ
jgi:hypothetical protein